MQQTSAPPSSTVISSAIVSLSKNGKRRHCTWRDVIFRFSSVESLHYFNVYLGPVSSWLHYEFVVHIYDENLPAWRTFETPTIPVYCLPFSIVQLTGAMMLDKASEEDSSRRGNEETAKDPTPSTSAKDAVYAMLGRWVILRLYVW